MAGSQNTGTSTKKKSHSVQNQIYVMKWCNMAKTLKDDDSDDGEGVKVEGEDSEDEVNPDMEPVL